MGAFGRYVRRVGSTCGTNLCCFLYCCRRDFSLIVASFSFVFCGHIDLFPCVCWNICPENGPANGGKRVKNKFPEAVKKKFLGKIM